MNANTQTTNYEVAGMTCQHCVNSVTAEVSEIPGVHDVRVDLAGGRLTVTSDRPMDREQVAAAVTEAGYQLAG
jgi:copper chaperone